jgi:CAAX protease family protein
MVLQPLPSPQAVLPSCEPPPREGARPVDPAVRRSRRGLLLFFALLLPPTALIQAFLFRHPELDGLAALLALLPALASVAARLLLREGFADVSFRVLSRPVLRGLTRGLLFAVLVAGVSFAAGSLTGLAPLDAHGAAAALGRPDTLILALVTLVLVTDEELGWRGYMLTRLVSARVPAPILTSGLIWGLWHVPLIYAGVYLPSGNRTLSAVLLMATILPFAAVSAQLRLTSGSVWPPVALHATWNVLMYEILGPASTTAAPWVGEAGAITALTTLTAAVVVLKAPTSPPGV